MFMASVYKMKLNYEDYSKNKFPDIKIFAFKISFSNVACAQLCNVLYDKRVRYNSITQDNEKEGLFYYN